MFNIVLYQPEIPPNTGNIIRLCANTGCKLHLIKPLGFDLDDKRMRRAGLDYHEWASVAVYDNWEGFINKTSAKNLYACSTKGKRRYSDVTYEKGDYLLFGPETRGLPDSILHEQGLENCLRLPMLPNSRSMNLSNAVSVFVYEAWRHIDFENSI
jgi:tRNA (cytidine/uridine-2'-O-)-methyltransferase